LRALQPHGAVKFKARRVARGAERKQKGAPPKLKYLTTFSILSDASTCSPNGIRARRVDRQAAAGEGAAAAKVPGEEGARVHARLPQGSLPPSPAHPLRNPGRCAGSRKAKYCLMARVPLQVLTHRGFCEGNGMRGRGLGSSSPCPTPSPAGRTANGASAERHFVNHFVAERGGGSGSSPYESHRDAGWTNSPRVLLLLAADGPGEPRAGRPAGTRPAEGCAGVSVASGRARWWHRRAAREAPHNWARHGCRNRGTRRQRSRPSQRGGRC